MACRHRAHLRQHVGCILQVQAARLQLGQAAAAGHVRALQAGGCVKARQDGDAGALEGPLTGYTVKAPPHHLQCSPDFIGPLCMLMSDTESAASVPAMQPCTWSTRKPPVLRIEWQKLQCPLPLTGEIEKPLPASCSTLQRPVQHQTGAAVLAGGPPDAGRHLLRRPLRSHEHPCWQRLDVSNSDSQMAPTAARQITRSMLLCQSTPSAPSALASAPIGSGHTDRAGPSASIGGAALKDRRASRLATWLAWAPMVARDWERTLQQGTYWCCRHTLYHGPDW